VSSGQKAMYEDMEREEREEQNAKWAAAGKKYKEAALAMPDVNLGAIIEELGKRLWELDKASLTRPQFRHLDEVKSSLELVFQTELVGRQW
jgi:hypothetical protein